MHVHPREYVCIINEKTKITWSELGKQNIQAKKVYFGYELGVLEKLGLAIVS